MSRFVQMDDWIFEIKTVRAIRVSNYGKPYSAIANVNLRGSEAYIDGLMTRNDDDFTNTDFDTFQKFCRKLGAKQMKYDRFKADKCKSIIVDLHEPEPVKERPRLQLV